MIAMTQGLGGLNTLLLADDSITLATNGTTYSISYKGSDIQRSRKYKREIFTFKKINQTLPRSLFSVKSSYGTKKVDDKPAAL